MGQLLSLLGLVAVDGVLSLDHGVCGYPGNSCVLLKSHMNSKVQLF